MGSCRALQFLHLQKTEPLSFIYSFLVYLYFLLFLAYFLLKTFVFSLSLVPQLHPITFLSIINFKTSEDIITSRDTKEKMS